MKLSSFLLAGTADCGPDAGNRPTGIGDAVPPVVGSATGTGCGVLITFNANGQHYRLRPVQAVHTHGIEDTGDRRDQQTAVTRSAA